MEADDGFQILEDISDEQALDRLEQLLDASNDLPVSIGMIQSNYKQKKTQKIWPRIKNWSFNFWASEEI